MITSPGAESAFAVSMRLTGGGSVERVTTQPPNARPNVLYAEGAEILWSSSSHCGVTDTDSGESRVFAVAAFGERVRDFVVTATHVYWATDNGTTGRIFRAPR